MNTKNTKNTKNYGWIQNLVGPNVTVMGQVELNAQAIDCISPSITENVRQELATIPDDQRQIAGIPETVA